MRGRSHPPAATFISVDNAPTFEDRGEVQSLRTDAADGEQCPLPTHYSWITTATSQHQFKCFEDCGDTSVYDLFFVCRNGLENV